MTNSSEISKALDKLLSYYDGINDCFEELGTIAKEIKEAIANSTVPFKIRKTQRESVTKYLVDHLKMHIESYQLHPFCNCMYEYSQSKDLISEFIAILESLPSAQKVISDDQMAASINAMSFTFTALTRDQAYEFYNRIVTFNESRGYYICDALYAAAEGVKLIPESNIYRQHLNMIIKAADNQKEADKIVLSEEYKKQVEIENKECPFAAMSNNIHKMVEPMLRQRDYIIAVSNVLKTL